VTLDKRAHNPYLLASGLADQPDSDALVWQQETDQFNLPEL